MQYGTLAEVEGPLSLGRGSGRGGSSCLGKKNFEICGLGGDGDGGDDEDGGDGDEDDDGEHGQACPVRAAVN